MKTESANLSLTPSLPLALCIFDPALVEQKHSLCHHSAPKIKPLPALALHKLGERTFLSLNKHFSISCLSTLSMKCLIFFFTPSNEFLEIVVKNNTTNFWTKCSRHSSFSRVVRKRSCRPWRHIVSKQWTYEHVKLFLLSSLTLTSANNPSRNSFQCLTMGLK